MKVPPRRGPFFHRLLLLLRDPSKEISESNMAALWRAETSLHHLFALPCPFIAVGRRMDGNVVKVGGFTVIAGGFLALLYLPLAVMTIALGAGVALIGLGMK